MAITAQIVPVGSIVTYEDMANAKSFFAVVGLPKGLHGQYGLWDIDDEQLTASDLRQAGWNVEYLNNFDN